MNCQKLKSTIKNNINPFDVAFVSTLFSSALLMLIGLKIPLVILVLCLYINVIFIACIIVVFYKRTRAFIKEVILFSVFSGISFPVGERILGYFIDWGKYTGPSFHILSTPIYVILYWVYLVFVMAYVYKKLLLFFDNQSICSTLVGVFAFIAGAAFENWGNLAGLWVNNRSHFMVGAVPLYVLLGYLSVFSTIRYLVIRPALGGVICSAFICGTWLALFHLLGIISGC